MKVLTHVRRGGSSNATSKWIRDLFFADRARAEGILSRSMSVPTPRPLSPLLEFLSIALLCLIWGSTWIVIASGLDDLPPFTSAAARFLVAAIAMTIVAHALHAREGGARPTLALSLPVGVLNFAASYGVVYWSETRLPSGIVSVLWAIYPMLMAASGHRFLAGERIAPRQWIGFAVAFLGVASLFVLDIAGFGAGAVPAAFVLLASPIVSCIGTTILKKHGAGTSSVLVNRDAMWIGAVLLTALAFTTEQPLAVHWTRAAVASVAYLAILGTVLTFTLYFWLLRRTPAYRLSTISYVTPAIALTLGAIVRREALSIWTMTGSLAILAGVALVVRGGRRAARS